MDYSNLFYGLRKQLDNDNQYALQELQDLLDGFLKYPIQTHKELQEYIFEKALDLNLCPKCFSSLGIRTYKDASVDYMGNNVSESLHKKYCNECGWNEDD